MERYEFSGEGSSKFWEVWVADKTLAVRFGRIGTTGQCKDKDFSTTEAAEKEKAKLIKEKTSKGYVAVGSAGSPPPAAAPTASVTQVSAVQEEPVAAPVSEPQPSAPADGPTLESVTDKGKLFDALPLPTRLRPCQSLTPEAAWQALVESFVRLAQDPFVAADPSARITPLAATPPVKMGVEQAVEFYNRLRNAFVDGRGRSRRAEFLEVASLFAQFLVGTHGALVAVQAADQLRIQVGQRGSAYTSCWGDPVAVATRMALPQAPEAAYDEAVGWCLAQCDDPADWQRQANFAFILGDDRASAHALQPGAVVAAAAANGVDVAGTTGLLPLIAGMPPAEAAKYRAKKNYVFYFVYSYVDAAVAAASMIGIAQARGESALPGLSWLMFYAAEGDRTIIARAMLETREPGALAELLPLLHEKWIRDALSEAIEIYPADMFRQCLAVTASARAEPAIRARVVEAITRYGIETARNWVSRMDTRAVKQLETLIEGVVVELAPEAEWPEVLRLAPWRRKAQKSDDIVLALTPVTTPFTYPADAHDGKPRYSWRTNRAVVVAEMSQLAAEIHKIEAGRPRNWARVPDSEEALPTPDAPGDVALAWLQRRLTSLYREVSSYGFSYGSGYGVLYSALERQPDALALALWEMTGPLLAANVHWPDALPLMLKRFGEQAVPGLLKLIESDPVAILPLVAQADEGGIAPFAARALLKLKKARAPAITWLRRNRETAMLRLIPDAVGAAGEPRDAAEHALRWLVADRPDGRAALDASSAHYVAADPKVADAMTQVLGRDPLARFPARIPKLPGWVAPARLTRPRLPNGKALPDAAVLAIIEMIAFSTADAVYAGIPLVRASCTAESLGGFAWDLFSAWLAEGAPPKEGWAMRAIGWLGNDECARQLTRLIRKWPGEAAHARAVTGLDVLTDIGSDIALMNLNGIAEKLKFKGLQERAREKIAALAEARDLTPEELADRLAPDLDLDAKGGLDLDFGPRQFRVGFDEFLKPWVKDDKGVRLKDLPKPNKSDDAEKAAEAAARWASIKKDTRAVASLQLVRLETMLATARRVKPAVFWNFFAAHPLMRNLARRLVWGLYDDTTPLSVPGTVFRVTEELGFSNAEDDPVELDVSEKAQGLIGLVHPMALDKARIEAWGALFGDYEIAQPFRQLSRETYTLTAAEAAASSIDRFKGIKVESNRLRGMAAQGWPLGSPQDAGVVHWIERNVPTAGGMRVNVMLGFGNGLYTGASEYEDKEQTLESLTIGGNWYGGSTSGEKFGDLDPLTASEMLRGLSLLAATGSK